MNKALKARLLGLAIVAALAALVTGCGSSDNGSVSGKQGNATDRAFVAEMVPHHKSAVAMANIAQQRGQSSFVKTLAGNIVTTQDSEIATMRSVDTGLAKAGIKRGKLGMPMHMMGMNMDVGMLRTANPFDRQFIDMMVPHHQAAVRMARVELAKGKNARLKTLAQAIIDGQSKEITGMNAHRTQAYGAASPAGGVPS